jgi:CheY-like chemotaxis protein
VTSGSQRASKLATERNQNARRILQKDGLRPPQGPVVLPNHSRQGFETPVPRYLEGIAAAGVAARVSLTGEVPVSNSALLTVLLVEDNEDNRIIYATALRYAGYEVLEAITGTEGVRLAREEQPGLILMDISIPELDGWEATAIIKADPATRHIPVVAVTAHALPGDAERSAEAGCDGYLAKPIPPAALVGEVDRWFNRATPSYSPISTPLAVVRE